MSRLDNELYIADVKKVSELHMNWNRLQNKNVLITGASGMIGTFLIDVLMYCNEVYKLNCTIMALARNQKNGLERFESYLESENFRFIVADINEPNSLQAIMPCHFVIHAASNTHPVAYATDPIGTISTNVIGTYNLLGFASKCGCERFAFISSVEVYGENRGDVDAFEESYCGYIDCNTLRAGYPESKRVGESLCQAYKKQHGLDVVIPRLPRVYGPTVRMSDTKAVSQFIKKGLNKQDIVLKSAGNQLYSYAYVGDAVAGILYCLFRGESGEAYNIASTDSDICLRELANIIADEAGVKVTFELPDEVEMAGYSKATKAIMDATKIRRLGWQPMYDISAGIKKTLDVLGDISIGEK